MVYSVDPSKVVGSKNWRAPESPTEIPSFLDWQRVNTEGLSKISPRSQAPHPVRLKGIRHMSPPQYIFDQKELNMRQSRWIALLIDYECEIQYHPARQMWWQTALAKRKTQAETKQASKDLKAPAEWLEISEAHSEQTS
ncbi:hypothetical protein Tco_1218966 [Tanacetum coccineum]